jgi:alpha-tubulin suppressor-like RCC1 family protein
MSRSGSAVRTSRFSENGHRRPRRLLVVVVATLLAVGAVPAVGVVVAHAQGTPQSVSVRLPVRKFGAKRDSTVSVIVKAISAGNAFSCALLADGTVDCWGFNDYGELGDGPNPTSKVPVAVVGLTAPAVAISAGAFHACALLANGTAECWGDNKFGQLGAGIGAPSSGGFGGGSNVAVPVVGLADAIAISSSGYHSCALLGNGHAECWGFNGNGELGDGAGLNNQYDTNVPVPVVGLTDAVAISAGLHHTCALLVNGHAECWGYNQYGELGNGGPPNANGCDDGTPQCSYVPVAVKGLTAPAVAISSAGYSHSCALLVTGHVECWGYNFYGQLGDNKSGGNANSKIAVAVKGLFGVVAISAGGGDHSCALLAAGQSECWGYNGSGQLGDDNPTNADSKIPVGVKGLAAVAVAISAGYNTTCALLVTGHAECWGYNQYGELGDNSPTNADSKIPVPVVGL